MIKGSEYVFHNCKWYQSPAYTVSCDMICMFMCAGTVYKCACVCVLIFVFAVSLRSGSQLISSLIQIMKRNDDKPFPFSCTFSASHKGDEFWMWQEMKFICHHNKVMSASAFSLSLIVWKHMQFKYMWLSKSHYSVSFINMYLEY